MRKLAAVNILVVIALGVVVPIGAASESLGKYQESIGSAIYCPIKLDPRDDPKTQTDFLATRLFSIGPHRIAPEDSLAFYAGFLHAVSAKRSGNSFFWEVSVDPAQQVIFSRPKASGAWQPRNFVLAEDTIIQGSVIPKGSEVWFEGYGVFHGLGEVRINVSKEAVIMGRKVGPAHVVIRGLKMTVNKDKNGGQDD
ncbi:MAG: hypothetical protein H6624_01210 [Bdellovibrionaceae bacterium]|nr:hypothetical protein [Bdellovibrionales bacterium]MCB9082927.1 hypothetical protein [Pseudobdellovibrionaceae bacterium]